MDVFFSNAFFLSLCDINQSQKKKASRVVVDGEGGKGMHFGVTQIPVLLWTLTLVGWIIMFGCDVFVSWQLCFSCAFFSSMVPVNYHYSYTARACTNGVVDFVKQYQLMAKYQYSVIARSLFPPVLLHNCFLFYCIRDLEQEVHVLFLLQVLPNTSADTEEQSMLGDVLQGSLGP